MRIVARGTLLGLAVLMVGCSEQFSSEDFEVGPDGEPPKILEGMRVYEKRFVAEQKNYVLAFGRIHAFLIANDYYPVVYRPCFGDVLDIKVTADVKRYKQRFPCVAVQAEFGVPTKSYLNITIEEVKFNQLDHDNRLIYTVAMFGRQDFARGFSSQVEASLEDLYSQRSSHNVP